MAVELTMVLLTERHIVLKAPSPKNPVPRTQKLKTKNELVRTTKFKRHQYTGSDNDLPFDRCIDRWNYQFGGLLEFWEPVASSQDQWRRRHHVESRWDVL